MLEFKNRFVRQENLYKEGLFEGKKSFLFSIFFENLFYSQKNISEIIPKIIIKSVSYFILIMVVSCCCC